MWESNPRIIRCPIKRLRGASELLAPLLCSHISCNSVALGNMLVVRLVLDYMVIRCRFYVCTIYRLRHAAHNCLRLYKNTYGDYYILQDIVVMINLLSSYLYEYYTVPVTIYILHLVVVCKIDIRTGKRIV